MKKNLLLVHLESLNKLNYKMNPDLFPVLREMEKHCLVFEQYYSTATSTFMVMGDLMYGGMKLYEVCSSLADIPKEYCYSSSIFDDLKAQGYQTGIYAFLDDADGISAEARHIAGFQSKLRVLNDYTQYVDAVVNRLDQPPFALMVCNYISNLSCNINVDINGYDMNVNYWEAGYRCMDRYCGELLKILADKDLMENTIIVFYGDHGDDYWGHGAHSGLTHAIEPNALLIHTPLFIWDGVLRGEPEYEQRLIQTSDLRELVMALINGEPIENCSRRQYVISRNEYAAQPVRAESFNKAYSVTEGHYLLMVSARGLEMYDMKMDPACQNNLLRFFTYENKVLKTKDELTKTYQYHFARFWNSRDQRILRQKFYELREILYSRTLELYIAGNRTEQDMLEEMTFGDLADMYGGA